MGFFAHIGTRIRTAIAAREERKVSARFVTRPRADHALLVRVTSPGLFPSRRQLRYSGLVFSGREQRLIVATAIIAVIAAAAAAWAFIGDRVAHTPASGGKLIEAVVGTPKGINPLYASTNDPDSDLVSLVFSGLFRRKNGVPEPDLAKSFEWSPDGTRLTVILNENLTFHDGTPLTSDDVLFTLQSAKDPAWRSPYAAAFRDASFSAPDDSTVIITLGQPYASFLDALTIGILPAHIWSDVSPQTAQLADANLKPIGAGPFMTKSFRRGSNGGILSYDMVRFGAYHGDKPLLGEIELRFFPDVASAEDAVRGGQADAVAFVYGTDADKFPKTTFIRSLTTLPEETVAFLNVNDSILKENRVREALAMSIDREDIVNIQSGFASPVGSPFPSDPPTIFASSTEDRLAAARQLLNAAGWTLPAGANVRLRTGGSNSTSTPNGASASSTLSFTITVPDVPNLIAIANVLAQRWSLLNARVTVEPEPAHSLLVRITRNRDAQIVVWNVLLSPSEDLYPIWWSGQADGSGLNLSNLKDRDVDAALKAIGAASSTEALAVAKQKLTAAILARTPAIFLTRPAYAYIFSKRVQGIPEKMTLGTPSDRFTDIAKWYVKTTWAWK